MHKKLLFIALTWLCAISSMADTLTIVNRFEKIEHASVLASYRNEFGVYRKPNMDVEFPYALIRVYIEGNEAAVTKAKERFALYLGQHYTTKAKNTNRVNEIMFLVPVGAGHVELQCGDGCQPLVLFDYSQLTADAIYEGKVRYAMEKQEPVQSTTTQAPKRQFFKFRVSPADAIVEVAEEGNVFKPWQLQDGIASDMLDWGTYRFRISANRYHAEEGTITVSDTQTEKTVTLQPKFGWLSITGGQNEQGAMVYATSEATHEKIQLGTIPVESKELMAGTYTIEVLRDQYHTFTTSVVVAEGKKAATTVQLIPTFGWLSITGDATSKGAFVYVTNQKTKERMQWGTIPVAQKSLTAGEYVIDIYKDKYKDYSTTITIAENKSHTLSPSLISNYSQIALQTNTDAEIWLDNKRLASHKSAYTNVEITTSSTGKTFTLNAPIPMYSTLIINGSPADATVYVDGNRVGVSPLVVNDMLVGEHTVRVTKSGYQKQELKVNLQENKEKTVKYSLKKGVEPTKPFSSTPVLVGNLYYQANAENPYTVCVSKTTEHLTHVEIPESIIFDGYAYDVTSIGESAFEEKARINTDENILESITIPNSVTRIGKKAFYGCKKLVAIDIPNSVTTIGPEAFCYSGLSSVKFPEGLTRISSKMFFGCDFTSLEIPNGVEYIDDEAFMYCKKLYSVTIPESVKWIGEDAFRHCDGLKTVVWNARHCNIPREGERFVDESPIGLSSPWSWGKTITSIAFGDSVEYIPQNVCKDVSGLTSVTIGKNVKEIGDDAFQDCDAIKSVVIPASVSSVGYYAFGSYRGALRSVTLLGETEINGLSFKGRKKITVYVPADLIKRYRKKNYSHEYRFKKIK